MTTELSNFAARLRERIPLLSDVAAEVTRLTLQNRQSAIGNRQLSEPPHQPSSHYGTAGVGSYDGDFNSLALELFALQFQHNAAYRKICAARSLTPGIVEHWTQIPAVPTAAFKELELTCLAPNERTTVFHSSGTTEQKPSRHFHSPESLKVYEASLWPWFQANMAIGAPNSDSACFPSGIARADSDQPSLRSFGAAGIGVPSARQFQLIILTPPPEQAPHSSLVHMFETVWQKLGGAETAFVGNTADTEAKRWGERPREPQTDMLDGSSVASPHQAAVMERGSWTLDFDAVLETLNSSLVTRHSSLLLGTAFSFVHLLDYLAERNLRFDLPAGSRVMETGGYKNRSRSLPKIELHQLITERLGVPPSCIICEYGMSELSSQAYDGIEVGVRPSPGAATLNRRVSSDFQESPDGSLLLRPGRAHSGSSIFHFPPWARMQIISPETGREVADGETGLIRVFDLANVFSVMAIQTEDLGIRRDEHFELIGRAALAEARGCSLMAV